jgi:hypothetical protein
LPKAENIRSHKRKLFSPTERPAVKEIYLCRSLSTNLILMSLPQRRDKLVQ